MPVNFIQLFWTVLAAAVGLALIVTLIAFSATVFVLAFTYIFIPLFIIASVRWLWLRYRLRKNGRIEYFDDRK